MSATCPRRRYHHSLCPSLKERAQGRQAKMHLWNPKVLSRKTESGTRSRLWNPILHEHDRISRSRASRPRPRHPPQLLQET
jgi:hypothetical protein